jgi:hypothetical protein
MSDGGAGAGGQASTGGATDQPDAAPPDKGTPTIVAVGYAGLRVASFDRGKTWVNKRTLSTTAADDPNNLRGVTFALGKFVAVGHKIFTSTDADEWTPRTHPENDSQWLGDVKFGNGRFVATGGYGYSVWSTDGETWKRGGSLKTEASRQLAFGNGKFVSYTDPGNWWTSTNGETWTSESGGHADGIAFCGGAFKDSSACGPAAGFGVYVRDGGWGSGKISWSTDAQTWTPVNVGFPGGVNAFAFGTTP